MTAVRTAEEKTRERRKRSLGASPGQVIKSAATRTHILETTITCLARHPYSEVSAHLIAEEAKVSRGGMQYHFPTRLSLLQATVEYLHKRRLEIFRADLLALGKDCDVIDHVIEAHWRHLNEREFRAYQELVLAARSEPELAQLLTSRYGAFLREWQEIARQIIGWNYVDAEVAEAGNIAHYILEGMAYGTMGGQLAEPDIKKLLNFAKNVMRQHL